MDNQDHGKNHTAGHESHGVHVCHKCGWPFPNPHPSAKHRRAHKKICGTIEGYKFVDSEVSVHSTISDDEHHSDEDRKTRGPRVLERSNNEKGSVDIGERSGRSEDKVFSDVVAEFSDSGFGRRTEEPQDDVKKPAMYLETVVDNEATAPSSVKDGAITATTPPPKNSANNSQMQNTEIQGNNTSVTAQESQAHVASDAVSFMDRSLTDYRTAGVYESNDDQNDSTCVSNTIQLGSQNDKSWQNTEETAGKDLADSVAKGNEATQTKTNSAVDDLIETDTNANKEMNLDRPLPDAVVSPCDNIGEASEPVSKLEKIEGINSDPVPASGSIQIKEQSNDELDSNLSLNALPPEVKSAEHVNTSIATAQVKVDASQAMDSASSGEGNDNFHVYSLPDYIPVLDNAEIMIRGFKDYEKWWPPQLVVVDSLEGINVVKDDSTNICSRPLNECTEVSGLGMHALKDDREQKGESNEHIVENVPDETEPVMPQVKMTGSESQRTEQIGAPADAGAIEIEKNYFVQCPGEKLPSDYCESSSHTSSMEHATKVLSDVKPVAAQVNSEVRQTINSVGADDASNYEKGNVIRCDIAENEDKRITENIIATESATEEGYSTLGSMEGKVSLKTPVMLESDKNIHESNVTSENVINASERNFSENECIQFSRVSDHQEGEKELESNDNRRVQVDGADRVNAAIESINVGDKDELQKSSDKVGDNDELQKYSDKVGDVELLQRPLDIIDDAVVLQKSEYVTKEPQLSSLDTSSSLQNPATVEVKSTGDFGVLSENQSKFSPDEGESKFVAQQHGASMTEFSVDSASQTDSLEGHWGSVSVLSTQSDIPAVTDAEASNGSKASIEAEKADLKEPKASSEGRHSDKSDIFEPPSFATLVEPRDGDISASASKPEAAQNLNQPAGWFPSFTHVTNESQGRKKNEEIISKVTNWSTGKQHTPLKNLLVEAITETKSKSLNAKENPPRVVEKDESSSRDNNALAPTVNSTLDTQVLVAESKKEAGKEWNSPARYPTDIKERRKVKGRPYWAQFVCCSSVN